MAINRENFKVTHTSIFLEIMGFVALALLSRALIAQYAWRFAGPISLVLIIGILTLYFRHRGLNWTNFGLRSLPGNKPKLMLVPQALLTFAAFAFVVAIVLHGSEALGLEFMRDRPQGVDDRWAAVEGNLPLYLTWLAAVWTGAAFGEEMFFRGYLVTRFRMLFSGHRIGPFLAVVFPALIFGYGHMYYQGLRGFVMTGAIAIAFGTMFLLFKRNLWPIILVHGIIDTLTFTAIYLGIE